MMATRRKVTGTEFFPVPDKYQISAALIDGPYRYTLTRIWDERRPPLVAIGCNPSRADAVTNDNTVVILCERAERAGFGGLELVNMAAYRATYPTDVLKAANPIGPDNMLHIRTMLTRIGRVYKGHPRTTILCCWGDAATQALKPAFFQQAIRDLDRCIDLMTMRPVCLGITRKGQPKHPLRIGYAEPMVPYFIPVVSGRIVKL